MKNKFFSMFDYLLILVISILITIGIIFIYSSSVNSDGISVTNEYIKQIIWASIGLVLMIGITYYDYRNLSSISPYLFIFLVVILIYTRIFGKYVNGAKSWIGIGEFGIQPSEFCKIIYILFFARYLENSQNEQPFKRFIISGLIFFVPFALILIQPDMGTASVYFPIFIIMCFIAGIPVKYILYILFLGAFSIIFAILPVWNDKIATKSIVAISILTNFNLRMILFFACFIISLIGIIVRRYFHGPRYFFWISYFFSILSISIILSLVVSKVLKDYQIQRLIIFLNPNIDPRGAGWNIIQSKIAIGAGGLTGKGFLNGTQSHYRFLPQQSTDFIFSILSEEFGFLGCMLVFFLYGIMFLRILYIMRVCSNKYGCYIASGIFGMFVFHFFINIGMVMGIMPITGIPLLFLSYGGSSLLTSMMCIGLLMSINYRRKDLK